MPAKKPAAAGPGVRPAPKPAAGAAPREPRVDAYIERAAPFARPILRHLRELVHQTCPEVAEAMKWSAPHFLLGGKIFFGMGAFKQHCAVGFWSAELAARVTAERPAEAKAMGQLGRIAALADLPSDRILQRWLKEGAALLKEGKVGRPKERKPPKPELDVPVDLARLLAANPVAFAKFDALTPSCRREYLEWIGEAKRPDTRARRLETTVQWVAEGKGRNWKYEACGS